ncbi:MAG: FtsQ-type POTRA domain-containing protein [Clostridium sp.]|jgi:cell division protein FtsQ|nr:FtsQ-type POTRA domain-containing protein [Clostridium sp.]
MAKRYFPRPGETVEQCRRRIFARRRLGAFGVLAAIVALIITLAYTAFFPMTSFNVDGQTRYSKAVLQQASGVDDRAQLLTLSTDKIRQRLLEQLPYLEDVTVKCRLPHTLSVSVKDAKTVLAVKTEDGYTIISGKGKVLELAKELPNGALPLALEEPYQTPVGGKIVFSEDSDKDDFTRQVFDALIAALESCAYRSDITSLDMTNPYSPTMSYQKRLTLSLGSRDSFASQLSFAGKLLDALAKEEAESHKTIKGTIDLKVDNGAFLREME